MLRQNKNHRQKRSKVRNRRLHGEERGQEPGVRNCRNTAGTEKKDSPGVSKLGDPARSHARNLMGKTISEEISTTIRELRDGP